MQIFALHENPRTAARYHCDKHVVKMPTESVQMLSTVVRQLGYIAPYKITHEHHPCVKWVAASEGNYKWLWELAYFLGEEYSYRYRRQHKAQTFLIEHVPYDMPDGCFALQERIEFADATGQQYEYSSVVRRYQRFYLEHKSHICAWTRRDPPDWFIRGMRLREE